MKILVVGPALFLPWTPYCAQALRRLGHSVESFFYSDISVDRLTLRAGRRAAAGFPPLAAGLDRWRERWHRRRDARLLRRVREARFDLILALRGETLSAPLLQDLRKGFSGPLVTWWVDDPFRHSAEKLLPHYDAFFIFDRSYVDRLKEAGARRVEFLPCCCDETVYRPRMLRPAEQRKYQSEIALVGWYYPARAEVVRELAGLDLKIWGKGWKSPEARRSLNGTGRGITLTERFVGDEEVSKIYSAAAIGLNIHSDQSHRAGLNTRAFELPAAGTFELTDYVEGMEELLVPGEEVAVYRSPEEARERAGYYLRHPEEREGMVRRGRERVLREHTYLHRMQTLLQTARGISR